MIKHMFNYLTNKLGYIATSHLKKALELSEGKALIKLFVDDREHARIWAASVGNASGYPYIAHDWWLGFKNFFVGVAQKDKPSSLLPGYRWVSMKWDMEHWITINTGEESTPELASYRAVDALAQYLEPCEGSARPTGLCQWLEDLMAIEALSKLGA